MTTNYHPPASVHRDMNREDLPNLSPCRQSHRVRFSIRPPRKPKSQKPAHLSARPAISRRLSASASQNRSVHNPHNDTISEVPSRILGSFCQTTHPGKPKIQKIRRTITPKSPKKPQGITMPASTGSENRKNRTTCHLPPARIHNPAQPRFPPADWVRFVNHPAELPPPAAPIRPKVNRSAQLCTTRRPTAPTPHRHRIIHNELRI